MIVDLDGHAGHRETAVRAVGEDPDVDRRPVGSVGEGVAHQVGDDLPQPGLIAEDQEGRAAADRQLDLPPGGDHPGVLHRVGGEGEQVNRPALDRPLLVEPRQQQHVLHQHPHPGGLLLHPLHDPVYVRLGEPAVGGQAGLGAAGAAWRAPLPVAAALPVVLGVAADSGQRRPQLVTGVGDELAHLFLGPPGGGLGRLPGVERGLDLRQHGVEGAAEPPDLGPGVAVGHPLGQVTRGDRPGGDLDVGQWAQAAADDRDTDDRQ